MTRKVGPLVRRSPTSASSRHDGVVVAHLQGEIDMSNADDLGTAFNAGPPDARALVARPRRVGYLDSAGIRMLYKLRDRLTRRGQGVRLVLGPDSAIATTLEYAGVNRTLGASATVPDAITDLEVSARSRISLRVGTLSREVRAAFGGRHGTDPPRRLLADSQSQPVWAMSGDAGGRTVGVVDSIPTERGLP